MKQPIFTIKLIWEHGVMVSRRTVYAKVTGSNPVVLVPLMKIRPLNKNLVRPFGICGFGLAIYRRKAWVVP